MIKGKAKMEFGTGDIRMTTCYSYEIGALCCITQPIHQIGERVPVEDTWSPNEAEVIMTFSKVESIDALIEELQDIKKLMLGQFPKEGKIDHEAPFDFDAFIEAEFKRLTHL